MSRTPPLALLVLPALFAACPGGGPDELRRLVGEAAERVQCRAAEARAEEHDGRYAIEVCGYRFAVDCHAHTRTLYRMGDRECEDATPEERGLEHAALSARRVVAAEGACPVERLTATWLVPPGPEGKGVARVTGCGRSARVSCPADALRPGACERLSFAEESHRDVLAAVRVGFAARTGCRADAITELPSSWRSLERPGGGPPPWAIALGGCGQKAGFLCARHDPEREEPAACTEVTLDGALVARTLEHARVAFARDRGCPAGTSLATLVRTDFDSTPRRELRAEVVGCGAQILYLCTFADLLAAEAQCRALDPEHHGPFREALEAAFAEDVAARPAKGCERGKTATGRRGQLYRFDVSACEHLLAYTCQHDPVQDTVRCAPDDEVRRIREAQRAALLEAFGRETACPAREISVRPAWPAHHGAGVGFDVLGCSASRRYVCPAPDASGPCVAAPSPR